MNIFATSDCPVESANALDTKRVIKMILETSQMLCSVLHTKGVKNVPYRIAHAKHPCTIWAGITRSNFDWLCVHGLALANIYRQTYGNIHKSEAIIKFCMRHRKRIADGPLQEFANCSLVKDSPQSVTQCYRDTMNIKWARDYKRPTWKGRNKPDWYINLGDIA